MNSLYKNLIVILTDFITILTRKCNFIFSNAHKTLFLLQYGVDFEVGEFCINFPRIRAGVYFGCESLHKRQKLFLRVCFHDMDSLCYTKGEIAFDI